MTAGHLVPDFKLTFLGKRNLSHLDNAAWQLVAHHGHELVTLEPSQDFTVFDIIIVQQPFHQVIDILIACPTGRIDGLVIQVHQSLCCKTSFLRQQLFLEIAEYPGRKIAA